MKGVCGVTGLILCAVAFVLGIVWIVLPARTVTGCLIVLPLLIAVVGIFLVLVSVRLAPRE